MALVNSKLALVTKEHMGLDGPFPERYVQSDSKYFAFCSDISCDRDFHASLFCVPKGCSLPLHNHPNMLVFGKVLRGKLRVSSFNVKDDISTALKPGTKVAAEFVTPTTLCCEGDLMFVSPGVRNVHKVEAEEDAVLFDIILPPYEMGSEYSCTYFDDGALPTSDAVSKHAIDSDRKIEERVEKCELTVIDEPGSFRTEPYPYTGPLLLSNAKRTNGAAHAGR